MRVVAVLIFWSTTGVAASANAEPFLRLPFTRAGTPITCRWSCLNQDGTTYRHQATDYGTPTSTEIQAAVTGEVTLIQDGIVAGQKVGKLFQRRP
jgi:hypothetical protein